MVMVKRAKGVMIVRCPKHDACLYGSAIEEEKKRTPDLRCPHEMPHLKYKLCVGNKCCPDCGLVDEYDPKELW